MVGNSVIKTADVRALEPKEDAELPLFEAPFHGVIANVTFTPSEEIRGAYYTRSLQLMVQPKEGQQHYVSHIQLGSTAILLPGGQKHSAELSLPATSLRVHEGDSLVWSSIGSVGEGLAVPAGSVEVVFERKDISEGLSLPELWVECVPEYWVGKTVRIEHYNRDIHGPNAPSGNFSATVQEYVANFLRAGSEGLIVALDPSEHHMGTDKETLFPWTQIAHIRLMENNDHEREVGEDESEDASEEGVPEFPMPASSLRDLLDQLTKMTTSLEQAWSEGLEGQSAKNARAEIKQILHSLLPACMGWMQHANKLREQAGLPAITLEEGFPIGDAGLSRLTLEPESLERHYYQLQIATVYAFNDLVQSVEPLVDSPTGEKITLPDGSVETWWEAGAFSTLRRRARSLSEIFERSDDVLLRILRENSADEGELAAYYKRPTWYSRLDSAFDMIHTGNYDSALPQLLTVLRSTLAESLSIGAQELPVPLAPAISGIRAMSSVAPHVPLLEEACELLGQGLYLDSGVAVPLAKELFPRIQNLAFNPPSVEQLGALRDSLHQDNSE